MAINAGDAVLTFLGDTTQLDQTFDKVNADAQSKLGPAAVAAKAVGTGLDDAAKTGGAAAAQLTGVWDRVAVATLANSTAQKTLQAATKAAQQSGSEDVVTMLALAQAQQKAAAASIEFADATKEARTETEDQTYTNREANEVLQAMDHTIGVQLPRGLRNLFTSIPAVGEALKAAFAVGVVLALVDVLGQVINKITLWADKTELMREAQAKLGADYADVSRGIQVQIDQQHEKIIALTQGPIAAMDFAIAHLRTTANTTLKSIDSELDATAQHFADVPSKLNPFFYFAGLSKASRDLKEFAADLTIAMYAAQHDNPGDEMAAYRAGIEETDKQVTKLTETIKKLQQANMNLPAAVFDTKALEAEKVVVQHYRDQLAEGVKLDKINAAAAAAQRTKDATDQAIQVGEAQVEGDKQTQMLRLQLGLAFTKQLYDHGMASYAQLIQQERDYEDQSYEAQKAALQKKGALLAEEPAFNKAAIVANHAAIQQLEITHEVNMLKIDGDAFNKQVSDQEKAFEKLIAGTKQGSAQRLQIEEQLTQYLLKARGSQSDQYQQQLVKQEQALRQYHLVQQALALEEVKGQIALSSDATKAQVAYYAYLVQTARASAATLLQIQHAADEQEYKDKALLLQTQIDLEDKLGRLDALKYEALQNQKTLLAQQHAEYEKLYAQQSKDVQETYYKELGLTSAAMYGRQAAIAKQAYGEIASSGKASYEQLLQAQIKVIEATIAWKTAMGQSVENEAKQVTNLTNKLHQLQLALGQVRTTATPMEAMFKALGLDINLMGGAAQNGALLFVGAVSSMVSAWSQGGISIAQAAEKMAVAVLQAISQMAFANAAVDMAKGFAAEVEDPPAAAAYFTAAAWWLAAGVATGIMAGVINNATSGSASSGTASAAPTTTQAPGITQGQTQGQNTTHLAGGGLATRPTLAVVGDAPGGGGGTEAVLPLENAGVMGLLGSEVGKFVAAALRLDASALVTPSTRAAARMSSEFGEQSISQRRRDAAENSTSSESKGISVHLEVHGLISPDNLRKVAGQVAKEISRQVKGNGIELTASNSFRVTKKS